MNELHRHFSLEGQGPWTEQGTFSTPDSEAKCTHLWVTLFIFYFSFICKAIFWHTWGLQVAQVIFHLMDSGLFQKDLILLNFAQL